MSGERDFWGEMGAIAREGINDVRQTMNEVFFGQNEHGMGMGTPMNPTSQIVTEELRPEMSYDDLKQQVAAQPQPSMEQELERD